MSWLVPWNGKDYDVDPGEFSGLELKQIKLLTGLTYRTLLEAVVREQDGEAICALFWTVDKRTDPDLKFSEYAGPPVKVWMPHLNALNEAMESLGKAMETPGMTGLQPSPNGSPPLETAPSTTD